MARRNVPVLIVGDSGSGKSSSVGKILDDNGEVKSMGLNPKEVILLNLEDKETPNHGQKEILEVIMKNLVQVRTFLQALVRLGQTKTKDESTQLINYIYQTFGIDIRGKQFLVIDSITQLTKFIQTYCSHKFNGYAVWDNYNEIILEILDLIKSSPIQVFVMALPEQKAENMGDIKHYASVKGKELKYGTIESNFTIVLFTKEIADNAEGETEEVLFQFKPNKFNTAKAPAGMFKKGMTNDLWQVYKSLYKYYNGVELDDWWEESKNS